MSSIKSLLRIPVSIKSFVGVDDMGEETHGPIKETTCYVDFATTNIIGRDGSETMSKAIFYLDGPDSVSEEDLILFDKVYVIKTVKYVREINGTIALCMVYV